MPHNRIPVATYRVQLHPGFGFDKARQVVAYLRKLGITELYSSPVLRARAGSTHGYDIVDAHELNPELGGATDFRRLVEELRANGLGLLLDVVPNHMAASSENRWWMNVLEFGPQSPYVRYFDVDWEPVTAHGTLTNRVLLPILGKPYGEVLEGQELKLECEGGRFFVSYYDNRVPIAPKTWTSILEEVGRRSAGESPWLVSFERISEIDWTLFSPAEAAETAERISSEMRSLISREPELRDALEQTLTRYNGVSGDPASFDLLDALLEAQWYRLSYWRMASHQINYRRFFDVTDLVGVRVEDPEVFEARNEEIFRLIEEGAVTGLRIDHIDGLFDPIAHLRRLQERITSGKSFDRFYVSVEKILAPEEILPESFAADGTTGYDFLNLVNAVFVDFDGLVRLTTVYEEFVGDTTPFEDTVYRTKKQVIEGLFAGEIRSLATLLARIAVADRNARDFSFPELLEAVIETTAALTVYRTYIRGFSVSAADRKYLEEALALARKRTAQSLDGRLFDFLRRILLLEKAQPGVNDDWLRFVMEWQQFTGRAMAKGVEDTAFYIYNRLLSLNEVGGEPSGESTDDPVQRFHAAAKRTVARWPLTQNASSTHDTKRSEDVRARLNVISEIPDVWERHLRKWRRANYPMKQRVDGVLLPDANAEMFLYQTILGAWPLEAAEEPAFLERLQGALEKSMREAKTHTSWLQPDERYEKALKDFATGILSPENRDFREDFAEFQKRIAFYGAINSLSQTTLKLTAPGIPDFYQGTELWDLSLVDPDNRRPVDYERRARLLAEISGTRKKSELVRDLLDHWVDGRVKMYVIASLLRLRQESKSLFIEGDYEALSGSGSADAHLCAFSRSLGDAAVIVAVPRLIASLVNPGQMPIGKSIWGDGHLHVPRGTQQWRNVLTDEVLDTASVGAGEASLPLSRVFESFPVAVLVRAE
jgi:(1->4)-alpha-D-glucan 1-alpha-D-glucosylmutase